jgi:excisionase family DNA binding protein
MGSAAAFSSPPPATFTRQPNRSSRVQPIPTGVTGSTSTREAEFVSVGEVARRLAVAPRTVVRAVERGELRGVRLGERGHWRIAREDVRRLLGEEGT